MKRFAVIGLSTFGRELAINLYKMGDEVLAVDRSKEKIQDISGRVSSAVVADIKSKEVLARLELQQMDGVMVCTGMQTTTSILITLLLKELGCKNIMVKAVDDDHSRILARVGADSVVIPEIDMAVKVAQTLHSPNFLEYIKLSSDFNIVETAPPYDFIGKTIAGLDLRKKYNIHVIGIRDVITEGIVIAPAADYTIKDSDVLIVIGHENDLKKLHLDQ
ncbi:MAG: TrkA family potassium uptake protein [Fibrobacterota bacterium]